METMNEKVAMVTGAAAGIGLASAEAFAKVGGSWFQKGIKLWHIAAMCPTCGL